jgi:hypothetical protein
MSQTALLDYLLNLSVSIDISKKVTKKQLKKKKYWRHNEWEFTFKVLCKHFLLSILSSTPKWRWMHSGLYKAKGRKLYKGIAVKNSLNGFTILNYQNHSVIKSLNLQFEPQFMLNEIRAKEMYTEFVPKIILQTNYKNNGIIVSELIKTSQKKNTINWNMEFPKIATTILKQDKIIDNIFVMPLARQRFDLLIELENLKPSNNRDYNDLFLKNRDILNIILNQNIFTKELETTLSLKRFSHGDLMPSNVIHKHDIFYIIDWANGGIHNYYFDLVIQEIYKPNSYAWSSLADLNFSVAQEKQIFSNGLSVFNEFQELNLGEKVNEHTVIISMILSIGEFLIKNFSRHDNEIAQNEGMKILKMVETILLNVLSGFSNKRNEYK